MKNIRTLLPHELPKYRDHLLRLSPEDRRLRFGYPISDDGVHTFIERLTARHDRILVHYSPTLQVIGAAQVAIKDRETAEMAFSVDAPYRGQGIGRDLFRRGMLLAGNRHIRRVYLYFLAENRSMRHLARDAGMEISLEAGECEATLAPPPATMTSLLAELTFEAQAAGEYLQRMNRQSFAPPFAVPRAA